MFNTVGRKDAFAPSRPRIKTMAGAPVFAPSTRVAPRINPPSTDPTTIAATAAGRFSGEAPEGCSIASAPAKPSRLTPRFPHRPSWSSRPSERGAASVRVSGASERRPRCAGSAASGLAEVEPGTGADGPGDDGVSDDGETETDTSANLSLRRY